MLFTKLKSIFLTVTLMIPLVYGVAIKFDEKTFFQHVDKITKETLSLIDNISTMARLKK